MKSLILLFASFVAANAATITTATMCASGPTVVYGSTQCSAVNDSVTLGGVTAFTNTGYGISGNELAVGFSQSATASAPNNYYIANTSANATATVSLELDTSGPIRSGYAAVLTPAFNEDDNDGYGLLSIGGAGYSVSCGVVDDSSCGLPFDLAVAEALGYKPLPITLGEEFSFSVTQGTYAYSGPDYGGYADMSSIVALELFDSDGVTPVNVFEVAPVPEPSSADLVILFVFVLTAYLLVRFAASGDRFASALERFAQFPNEQESQQTLGAFLSN